MSEKREYTDARDQLDTFIPLKDDADYKPKQPDFEKIKNYKDVE